jgi:sugar-specific transcriptional regulator TrmB
VQFKSPLSKQTKGIYSLLLDKGPLSAEQIANELNIFPQAVYRSTQQLQKLGCVNQFGKHPAVFGAISAIDAVETFTLLQREWFLDAFVNSQQNNSIELKPNITFIESREMLFEKSLSDINNLKEEMDNLASGDELPAEIMLAQKNALDRGVNIRTIFQKRDEKNESFIRARTLMGEQFRISKALNTRIVIFDRRVVYVMSYDPTNYLKSVGIRFEYDSLGQLMYQLFLQYWKQSADL